jgi:hypothetical protein
MGNVSRPTSIPDGTACLNTIFGAYRVPLLNLDNRSRGRGRGREGALFMLPSYFRAMIRAYTTARRNDAEHRLF